MSLCYAIYSIVTRIPLGCLRCLDTGVLGWWLCLFWWGVAGVWSLLGVEGWGYVDFVSLCYAIYSIVTRIPPGCLRCLDSGVSNLLWYHFFFVFRHFFKDCDLRKLHFYCNFHFLFCSVCNTCFSDPGWPGLGLERVPIMSLN